MVQILEGNSFSSQMGKAVGEGLGTFGAQVLQRHAEQKRSKQFADAFKKMSGMDIADLPPEAQQEFVKQFAKQHSQMQMLNQMAPELFGGQGAELQQGGTNGVSTSRGISGSTPEQRMKISMVNPALAKAMSREEDLKLKQSEAQKAEESRGKESKYLEKTLGIDLSDIKDPATRKTLIAEAQKEKRQTEEREKAASDIKQNSDWLKNNIKFAGTFGVSPKWGGIEAQGESRDLALKHPETGKPMSNLEIKEIREGIDATGLWLADKVYTHFNVGVINKPKWEDLKNRFAPRADLPASINRARIAALERIMGLPPDAPVGAVDKMINAENKALTKIEKAKKIEPEAKGKKLTNAVLDQFLLQANDDPEEASRLAKEAGYTW